MVYVNFHKPICPRDFSITIYGQNLLSTGRRLLALIATIQTGKCQWDGGASESLSI